MSIDALIDRLEAATGPDEAIAIAINEHFDIASYVTDDGDMTASVDAAIAFAELVLPDHGRIGGKGRTKPSEPLYGYQIFKRSYQPFSLSNPIGEAEHELEPIALTMAVLLACKAKGIGRG